MAATSATRPRRAATCSGRTSTRTSCFEGWRRCRGRGAEPRIGSGPSGEGTCRCGRRYGFASLLANAMAGPELEGGAALGGEFLRRRPRREGFSRPAKSLLGLVELMGLNP